MCVLVRAVLQVGLTKTPKSLWIGLNDTPFECGRVELALEPNGVSVPLCLTAAILLHVTGVADSEDAVNCASNTLHVLC